MAEEETKERSQRVISLDKNAHRILLAVKRHLEEQGRKPSYSDTIRELNSKYNIDMSILDAEDSDEEEPIEVEK